jgi:asparagine synthase (glutamine-hydrolysing)
MSGITGILHRDGALAEAAGLMRMTQALARRGPDGQHIWVDGSVGLGHAAFWTTPEAVGEQQPLTLDGQVWITADARLDERLELQRALEAKGCAVADGASDAALILHAYATWGEDCVDHLIGDFAFAVWDGRLRKLVCARDRVGVRTLLYYDRAPLFIFASDSSAILDCPGVNLSLNEPRIGDYLLGLEWYDKTSTFYQHLSRLEAGHVLVISAERVTKREYWRYAIQPVLRLRRDEEYIEVFLALFTSAVRSRLRAPDPAQVGSMLSGGLDSSSIVAVAREDYRQRGLPPFRTVSGLANRTPNDALESYFIEAVIAQGGLDPMRLRPEDMLRFREQLDEALLHPLDLFDQWMTMPQVAFLAARDRGMRVLMTGVGGNEFADLPLDYPYFWLRQGRPLRALAALRGQNAFHIQLQPRARSILAQFARWTAWHLLRHCFPVKPFLDARQRRNLDHAYLRALSSSIIDLAFAEQIDLRRRWNQPAAASGREHMPDLRTWQTAILNAPLLDIGLARYDRVAALAGMETRHPYCDQRLIEFLLAIPPEQIVRDDWPKGLARASLRGLLTDEVRYRRGIQHVGWTYAQARWRMEQERFRHMIEGEMATVAGCVNRDKLRAAYAAFAAGADDAGEDLWQGLTLELWLAGQRNAWQRS